MLKVSNGAGHISWNGAPLSRRLRFCASCDAAGAVEPVLSSDALLRGVVGLLAETDLAMERAGEPNDAIPGEQATVSLLS